jgi:hypothetical protein
LLLVLTEVTIICAVNTIRLVTSLDNTSIKRQGRIIKKFISSSFMRKS